MLLFLAIFPLCSIIIRTSLASYTRESQHCSHTALNLCHCRATLKHCCPTVPHKTSPYSHCTVTRQVCGVVLLLTQLCFQNCGMVVILHLLPSATAGWCCQISAALCKYHTRSDHCCTEWLLSAILYYYISRLLNSSVRLQHSTIITPVHCQTPTTRHQYHISAVPQDCVTTPLHCQCSSPDARSCTRCIPAQQKVHSRVLFCNCCTELVCKRVIRLR